MQNPSASSRPQSFIPHLHAFRGIAIISVVLSHAFGGQIFFNGGINASNDTLLLNSLQDVLFHGSTIYFALISGLLFSLVLKSRGWLSFYKSKLLYVVLPFIIISFIFTVFVWKGSSLSFVLFEGSPVEFVKSIIKNILTGRALYPLWYIPVLIFLYAVTPAISWLVDRRQWFLLGLLIFLPLVCTRTWPEHSVSNFIYFVGVYTLGICLGAEYDKIIKLLVKYCYPMFFIVVILSAVIFFLEYHKLGRVGFINVSEAMWYLQKIFLSFVLIVALKKVEDRLPQWIFLIGTYAFSIYFLHGAFLFYFGGLALRFGWSNDSLGTLIAMSLLTGFLTLMGSLWLSMLCKKIAGKKSRMLVGS